MTGTNSLAYSREEVLIAVRTEPAHFGLWERIHSLRDRLPQAVSGIFDLLVMYTFYTLRFLSTEAVRVDCCRGLRLSGLQHSRGSPLMAIV